MPKYIKNVFNKGKPAKPYTDIFKQPVKKKEVESAVLLTLRAGKVSPSLIQRQMKIGYAKAVVLIRLLEDAGIVSEWLKDVTKPRHIILKNEAQAVNAALRQLRKGNR